MRPTKHEDALVDVLDVLLRDGAVVRADVVVSIADVPLVGIKLTAAIAGMETMTEYGLFEAWDVERRTAPSVARRQYTSEGAPRRIPGSPVTVGHRGRLSPRRSQTVDARERVSDDGDQATGDGDRQE